MDIINNIENIRKEIPQGVTLIAVSKTKPEEDIMQAYSCGQRVFGENKAQELKQKHADLPEDIQWHFIGHLQENKIKYIINFVTLIHSVDSLKLLKEINKRAATCQRTVDCLFEMDISHEESKFGLSEKEVYSILQSEEYKQLNNIRICGVMGVGSITDDPNQTRKEFKELKNIFNNLKQTFFQDKDYFKEISMGMTGDYPIAIEEGATLIRIGSKIFGARDYSKNNTEQA
ncbi:MAG: YggS family pyridoxal phosphate-dependent enzyme [Bacteroidales bacterium]|nr:YggS family pyridoxal phosphate-dependent enzyme [Bacteroidales bacterium]